MPRRGTRGPPVEPAENVDDAVTSAEESGSDTGGSAPAGEAGAAGGAVVQDEDESDVGSEQAIEQAAAWADLMDAEVPNAAADHDFAQPVIAAGMNAQQPVPGQPAQPALARPYHMPGQLQPLLVAQGAANRGPGGRAFGMVPEELQAYFRAAAKLVLVPSLNFNKAPRTPAAQTDLLQTIDTMCRYIAAFNQAHLSQEERVMLWLGTHFTEGAASAFRTAQAEARLTPSISGIGRASVLYRTLYNMVVLYDNPQSQQEAYSALKTLKWLGTIAKTHLHFSEVFKNYQALVAATALNPVATRAGALSWEQKFAYIHAVLPAWAKDRIRVAPEAVDTEEDLW